MIVTLGEKFAETMEEWSKLVAKRYDYRCAWVGCSSTFGLGGHHIIPRRNKATRLMIDNGLELCTEHHGIVESAKGTQRYDRMITTLVGAKRYEKLRTVAMISQVNDVHEEVIMPSSEVDF